MALISKVINKAAAPMEGANLAVLQSLMDRIDSGELNFYEKTEDFNLTVSLTDFNFLKLDTALYNKINLPFQITIWNNTFMKTRMFRVVSRKLPNTINWFTDVELPLDIEINEEKSFIIYVAIDSLDDLDWLIDNDMAFMLYTDNTTLAEVDFAIHVPDIRELTKYRAYEDTTLDLDDWYLQGLTDFDDILMKAFKLDDEQRVYSKLKEFQNFMDISADSTYGSAAVESVLSNIQDNNKLSNLRDVDLPADFIYNLINMSESKAFRDKFQFNVIRFTYYEGITDKTVAIGYEDAKSVFNAWRTANASAIQTNINDTDPDTQKNNMDGLLYMVRIPFFGSEWMYYDAVFFILNTCKRNVYIFENHDVAKFVGDYIRLSVLFDETPSIANNTIQYDISSQVKECLTTFQSFEAKNYSKTPDSTYSLGYKILDASTNIIFGDLLTESDVTVSYYYTNPILAFKKNWVVYEHSEAFRTNMLNYDWTTYFGIDSTEAFPDNSIQLYSVEYKVQKQIYDTRLEDWTETDTTQDVTNAISISVSNQVLNSFAILSMHNISNGASTLLLSDTTKDLDIVFIDKIEIFNDGNTFLNISGVQMFLPNGKFKYGDRWEKEYPDDMIKQDQIVSDDAFYKSFFDSETPVQVMSFNSLAPGETGDLYVVYNLNRNMVNSYLSEFFHIPIYLRVEFNSDMAAYFCHMATNEFHSLAAYNAYYFDGGVRNRLGSYYPYWQQMYNELDLNVPSDRWKPYAHTNEILDISNVWWKSKFQYDLAYFSEAIVKSDTSYLDMKNTEPHSGGVMWDGNMTPFSYMFIFPTSYDMGKITSVNELIGLYETTPISKLDYRMYIMNFSSFFSQMIEDVKNKYYLVSMVASTKLAPSASDDFVVYFRYDASNEYEWYDYELETLDRETKPFDLSWLKGLTATVTINSPETQLNSFTFSLPKSVAFAEVCTLSTGMFNDLLNGASDADATNILSGQGISAQRTKELAGKANKQYLSDRYCTLYDMGTIVGNKQLTMTVSTEYMNMFRIKSFDNFEVANQAIGASVPDVYSMRIVNPELEYANIIFEFMKADYTTDFTWEHKIEESITQNAGNYLITPSYFDLQYIPIDDTYSVMMKIKNQNPYSVGLTMLRMDNDTADTIKIASFPDNDEYNKMFLYLGKTEYTMLPNEEVKIFFHIIPRRIGMNFFTVYFKLNNSIRPVNFEFRSFINQKAYFVLDNDSKNVDFGDVPIGKYVEEPIIVKNIGNVVGKVNSIYTFGNDAKWFKLLDRSNGTTISERISYNKIVKPKQSLSIPIRFYSQSYGFNYSYCYIETNEPVLEDAQWFEGDVGSTDITQLYSNAPKYLVSLLKANSVIENEAIETDSYIFLGYVNPLKSKFRTYDVQIRNKNKNKIISVFKVTNLMKNYINVKYSREPFNVDSSLFISLNPRGFTDGWYYDELFVWMLVYDKNTRKSTLVLNKIPVSWYVTREQRLSFDVDFEELIFATKPFLKSYKKVHIKNYSNEDATLFMNLLTDHSGLFTIIPDLNNETVVIPEGVNYTFLATFGGDQRFIGRQTTTLTVQLTLGDETITKIIPVTGIVGDDNIVKFYRRNLIVIGS